MMINVLKKNVFAFVCVEQHTSNAEQTRLLHMYQVRIIKLPSATYRVPMCSLRSFQTVFWGGGWVEVFVLFGMRLVRFKAKCSFSRKNTLATQGRSQTVAWRWLLILAGCDDFSNVWWHCADHCSVGNQRLIMACVWVAVSGSSRFNCCVRVVRGMNPAMLGWWRCILALWPHIRPVLGLIQPAEKKEPRIVCARLCVPAPCPTCQGMATAFTPICAEKRRLHRKKLNQGSAMARNLLQKYHWSWFVSFYFGNVCVPSGIPFCLQKGWSCDRDPLQKVL